MFDPGPEAAPLLAHPAGRPIGPSDGGRAATPAGGAGPGAPARTAPAYAHYYSSMAAAVPPYAPPGRSALRAVLRWLSALAALAALGAALAAGLQLGDRLAPLAVLVRAAPGLAGSAPQRGAAAARNESGGLFARVLSSFEPEPLPEAALLEPALPVAPAIVPAPPEAWPDPFLQEQLEAAIPEGVGHVAVAVRHLGSGASAAIDADAVMPPASLFKLGVLAAAYQAIDSGTLALDEALRLTPEDWADGAGILQQRIGELVTVEEALRLMISISDNTAALALLHRLGPEAVEEAYARLGLVHSHVFLDDRPDTTTAGETATLLAALAAGELASPAATLQMLELLVQPQPQAWIEQALPAGALVAHKSGQLPGVRNDAAIIYGPAGPYVLVVLADNLEDAGAGEALIGTVARAVDRYFLSLHPYRLHGSVATLPDS